MPLSKKRNPEVIALEKSGEMVKACDIVCPGKDLFIPEDTGGVASFNGPQACGKTIYTIDKLCLLLKGGWCQLFSDRWQWIEPRTYIPQKVFSNRWIDIPGVNYMCNDDLKEIMYRAYGKHSRELGQWTRCIFMIFEADSQYSHLESNDKKVAEKLLNVSQSMCYGNWVFFEYHEGTGVLALLRQKREIACEPVFDRESDIIHLDIYNGQTMDAYDQDLEKASRYFSMYKRHNGTI